MKVRKILCICSDNQFFSPVMEVTLKRELRVNLADFIEVKSAGVHPRINSGQPPNNKLIKEMSNKGIDIANHKTQKISEIPNIEKYDLVLSINEEDLIFFKKYMKERSFLVPATYLMSKQDMKSLIKSPNYHRKVSDIIENQIKIAVDRILFPATVI